MQVLGADRIHELLSSRAHELVIVYSSVATPFSRCRAFCRWLLRAGHATLPVARLRRLRGGVHGWSHFGGELVLPIEHHPGGGVPRWMISRDRRVVKPPAPRPVDVD